MREFKITFLMEVDLYADKKCYTEKVPMTIPIFAKDENEARERAYHIVKNAVLSSAGEVIEGEAC